MVPEKVLQIEYAPAGAGWRFLAFLLDLVGFCVLASPLLLYCYAQSWRNQAHEGSPEYWLTYAVFVACTGCEALTGASVGKWVVKLRVLDAKTMDPVHWRASARWLLKLLPVHALIVIIGIEQSSGGRVAEWLFAIARLYLPILFLVGLRMGGKQWPHDLCTRVGVFRRNAARRGFDVVYGWDPIALAPSSTSEVHNTPAKIRPALPPAA